MQGEPKAARVAFLVPYLGVWPRWCRLFFESCRTNPEVAIIVLCESPPPFPLPANVHVVSMRRSEIIGRLEKVTGLNLGNLHGHKLSDLKPFYGLAFADMLEKYQFWGFCDIDMMFGNLEKLFTDEFFDSIDVFSSHNEMIVGHFTVLRNTPAVNRLCFRIESWKQLCLSPMAEHMDEQRFAEALRKDSSIRWKRSASLQEELQGSFGRFGITFTFFGEVAYLESADTPVVQWENGSVYYHDAAGKSTEVLYVHFMGLKHWWHWCLFDAKSFLQRTHCFSRIGYGDVSSASALHYFPWKQVYWVQTCLVRSKTGLGALLRKALPSDVFLALRRKLNV